MMQTRNEDHEIDFPQGSPDNRRQAARSLTERGHCFSLEHANGTVIGALLDYSPKGLGLETFEPLDVGQSVVLKGNVEVNGVWKKVQGEAQVIHCEPSGDGAFRLGLAAKDMAWLATLDPNTPFLQLSPRYTSG